MQQDLWRSSPHPGRPPARIPTKPPSVEVSRETTPSPLRFSKHSSSSHCPKWLTQMEMLPPSWGSNSWGEARTRSLPLWNRSTSAVQTSKAESWGPCSMGAALYLPSHSLIFSSTNNSPFARSWFCQKRTKNTRVELLCSVTTLFHFQRARVQRSGHL